MSTDNKNRAPITAGEVGQAGCGLMVALGCFLPIFLLSLLFLYFLIFPGH